MALRHLIFVLLAIAYLWIYRFSIFLFAKRNMFNHRPGPCTILDNVDHGSEDIALLPGDKALITSGLVFFPVVNNPYYADVKGKLFLFDFNEPVKGAQPVTIKNMPHRLNPHGLDVYVDDNTGEVLVFIVNHLEVYSVVEIFLYNDEEQSLHHEETVGMKDKHFGVLNDVVALGRREFYATNCMYNRNMLEVLVGLRWGGVVYYDGKQSHVVATGMTFPNGIAASLDGKYIYVMHSFDQEVQTFTRLEDNTLNLTHSSPVYMFPDNAIVDPDSGDLWTAGATGQGTDGHKHFDNPRENSIGSKVMRFRMHEGQVTEITEVLADDGKLFSGASVAMYRKDLLLVGSVVDKFMVCEVRYLH